MIFFNNIDEINLNLDLNEIDTEFDEEVDLNTLSSKTSLLNKEEVKKESESKSKFVFFNDV